MEFPLMPTLLETFAEQQSQHWRRFSQSYEDEHRSIQTISDAQQRARREAVAARSFARAVVTCAGEMEGFIEDVEDTLQEGISGDDFRLLAHAGTMLINACQLLIDTANKACEQAEAIGSSQLMVKARKM